MIRIRFSLLVLTMSAIPPIEDPTVKKTLTSNTNLRKGQRSFCRQISKSKEIQNARRPCGFRQGAIFFGDLIFLFPTPDPSPEAQVRKSHFALPGPSAQQPGTGLVESPQHNYRSHLQNHLVILTRISTTEIGTR